MLKPKMKISVFFLITMIFASLILTNSPEISNITLGEDYDKSNTISTPKTNLAPVFEKWNDAVTAPLTMVDISENGEYIVSIHSDNVTLKDWNNNSLWTYELSSGSPTDVGISWDGEYVVASNLETTIYLLNKTIETPKNEVWWFNHGSPDTTFCEISADGQKIAATASNVLYLFNNSYSSSEKIEEWKHLGGSTFSSLAMSADGNYIAAGSGDGYVYLFNTTYGNPKTWEIQFNTSANTMWVDISADGKYIVAGNIDNEVYLLNTTDFQGTAMWNYTSSYNLVDLDISSQGNHIVAGYNTIFSPQGIINQFNNTISAGNKIPEWSYTYYAGESIKDFDISSDGRYIVAGYQHTSIGEDSVVLLNTTNSPKNKIWSKVNVDGADMKSVAISSNGEYIVSGEANQDKIYFFYQDFPKTPMSQLQNLWNYSTTGNVLDVGISKDGEYIAAINSTSVYLFSKSSNKTLWSYPGSSGTPVSLEISYNGKYIVFTDSEGDVYLLNNTVESPKTVMWKWQFASPFDADCAISPDGEKIAFVDGHDLHLFNNSYSSNKQPEWIYNDIGFVPNKVAISPDGEKIAVANGNYVDLFNTSLITPKTFEWRFDTSFSVKKVDIGYDYSKKIYYIAAYNDDDVVFLLNSTVNNPKTAMWNYSVSTGIVNDLVISDLGNYIVAGEDSGYIYVFNNTFSTEKAPEWENKKDNREVKSVDISSDGKYIIVGYFKNYVPDWGLLQLFDTSEADPEDPISWALTKSVTSVAISGLGDHIAVGTPNPYIYLYYHYVYIPPVIIAITSGDGDDDDEDIPEIPFGNYYLIFVAISVISLIMIKKRKVILKEK